MKPSCQLIEYLNRTQLPWMRWDEQKQKLIVVADNHLLNTYRNCPQHFIYSNVLGLQRKSERREDEKARSWFLDFGICLHKMLELYYQDFRNPGFDVFAWAVDRAVHEWREMDMDVHAEHKEYKTIGGMTGFVNLLVQYGRTMTPMNEKLRILGAEVSFGRAGEVPLFLSSELEIYLAGRMDLIVDDGYFICPMDHKTMGTFRGDPGLQFETEEGPTGYIYALSKILPTIVPEGEFLKRDCSKILMNLIQKKPTENPAERFRRVPIRKSSTQLAEYRERMCGTVRHLILDMENFITTGITVRNTTACVNWHYGYCDYRDICRQASGEGRIATITNGYIQLPIWDTEEVKPTTK